MAPFLRAGLHGLRSSLCSQSEHYLLKLRESNHSKRRWFAETAVLEDSTQTASDAASENGAASSGSDVVTTVKDAHEVGVTNETGNGVVKQESVSPESSTDKLTSLILGKMRSKNIASGPRDSSSPASQPGSSFLKGGKPLGESKEPVTMDKWDQVMVSMRNMAAKKREGSMMANTKPAPPKSDDNDDDFADLDLPSEHLSRALRNSNKLPSTDETLKSFLSNSKQRESGKDKAKEAKSVSFSFLKALDGDPTPSRAPSSDLSSLLRSSPRPKDNGIVQPPRNEAKPSTLDSSDSVSDKLNRESLDSPKGTPDTLEQMKTPTAGFMVCVENIANTNHFILAKEALSVYGEIISSYKKPIANKSSFNAIIEFKTAEAMDDALAGRWVHLDSNAYGIVRVVSPCTTVVRLSKVSASTTDKEIYAICEKYGSLDSIRRRGTGSYDVFFSPGELKNMCKVLDCLNDVTSNQSRWIAEPAPLLHPLSRKIVLKSSVGQAWHAQQLSQILMKIETGLHAVSLSFEDLKSLVAMEDEMTK